jgi:hypothetical protein
MALNIVRPAHDGPAKSREIAPGHRAEAAISWQELSVAYHPPR